MLRHTLAYGLGNVANRLVGFILLPVYTRAIPSDELGILWVMNAASGLLSTFLAMGMTSAIFRFYFKADRDDERNRIISTAFLFLGALSSVVLLGVWLAREPLAALLAGDPAHARYVGIVAAGVFFDVGLFVPLALLRAQERSARFALISLFRFVIGIIVNVWLVVHLRMGAYGVLLGTALTNASLFAFLLPMVLRRLRFDLERRLLRQLVRFGIPIMFATIGSFLVDSSDLWLLRAIRGLDEVSRYGTVYRIAKMVQVLIVQPFTLAWPAVMWSLERRPEGPKIYARILTYAVFVTAFCALGASLFRREVIVVLATREFLVADWIMPWVVFGFVFLASHYVFNTGVSQVGRTEFITWTVVISVVVNVGLNLLLIPSYGMRGAAVSTFVAYVVMAGTMFFFSQRLKPIAFEWGRLGAIAAAAALLAVLGVIAESVPGAAGLGLRATLWMLFPVALLLNRAFLRREERERLARLWRDLGRRGRWNRDARAS
jgi:O-antigen/teichoic acid export membrane protein